MTTIIKATAVSTNKSSLSSIEHAVEAGRLCIEHAGISTKDVDLLINVGVYRDKNMLEPAMAALIQKGIGIKGDYFKGQVEKAAFSVDLMNGACGLINGLQVADSLFKSKQIKYALIVSGDAHPSNKANDAFPYSCVGAAMLLEYSNDDQVGFSNFSFKNSETIEHSSRGYLDLSTNNEPARDRLTVSIPETYQEKLFEFASGSVNDYLNSLNIDRSNLKLVTSQICEGFGQRLAKTLGLKDDSIIDLYEEHGDAHTSAVSMAYHFGSKNGLYKKADKLLFVAAGAGLSTACSLYSV